MDVLNTHRMNGTYCKEEIVRKDVVNEVHDYKNNIILTPLQNFISKCEQFQVTLNSLGCFSGKNVDFFWFILIVCLMIPTFPSLIKVIIMWMITMDIQL